MLSCFSSDLLWKHVLSILKSEKLCSSPWNVSVVSQLPNSRHWSPITLSETLAVFFMASTSFQSKHCLNLLWTKPREHTEWVQCLCSSFAVEWIVVFCGSHPGPGRALEIATCFRIVEIVWIGWCRPRTKFQFQIVFPRRRNSIRGPDDDREISKRNSIKTGAFYHWLIGVKTGILTQWSKTIMIGQWTVS